MNFNYLVFLIGAICIVIIIKKVFLFDARYSSKCSASIDYIKVGWLDNQYSPDVEIFYSYNVAGKIYKSSAFIQISEIIHTDFELYNENGFPILNVGELEFVGEEHIENYLLQCRSIVMIEYNFKDPSESRIVDLDQIPIIDCDQTDFPWKT